MSYKSLCLALLICLPASHTLSAQTTTALPEMGDSSTTVLSTEDELRIGREAMRQLKTNGALLDDPIVTGYLQQLGTRISATANVPTTHFTFFVVKDASINAFAMPGGFIGVNAGLLTASQNENELASVIAHEIAHVTQHHIARSVEQANKMNLPMTAAVIAALLLGASDPQMANAAMAATLGGSQQMKIDFTRANEHEADRVGMQLLSASEFDPRGMADFFSRLEEESRYYGRGVPEFLRTHPVTTDRIAEAADRARQYPLMITSDSDQYGLVKARLHLLLTDSPNALLQQLETDTPAKAPVNKSDQYLRALLYEKLGKTEAARSLYTALLKSHPEHIAFIYGLGELESSQGNLKRAISLYQEGLKMYPGNELLSLSLAEVLLENHDTHRAREIVQKQIIRNPDSSHAYHLLAKLEAASGNQAASHLAQAEYYYLEGEPHSALDQLTTAKRLKSLDLYHAARVDAMLEKIKNEMKLLERQPDE